MTMCEVLWRPGVRAAALAVLLAPAACTSPDDPADGALRLEVTPAEVVFARVGDTLTLRAAVLDAGGRRVPSSVRWSATEAAVATVDGAGRVRAVGRGRGAVVARAGEAQAVVPVAVAPDTVPPTLAGAFVDRARVPVQTAAAVVTLTLDVRDEGDGVAQVIGQFHSPAGAAITNLVLLALAEGSPREGRWSGPLTVPANSAQGTWRLALVQIGDAAGNVRSLDEAALAAAGYDVSFEAVWTR